MTMLYPGQWFADGWAFLAAHPRTLLLLIVLGIATLGDLRCRRIPNALVAAAIAASIVDTLIRPDAGPDIVQTIAGGIVGLGLMLPAYLLRAMGGGDVKLMAAVGAILGLPCAPYAVLGTLIAGGALSMLYAIHAGRMAMVLGNVQSIVNQALLSVLRGRAPTRAEPMHSAGSIPYALAISVGTLAATAVMGLPDR